MARIDELFASDDTPWMLARPPPSGDNSLLRVFTVVVLVRGRNTCSRGCVIVVEFRTSAARYTTIWTVVCSACSTLERLCPNSYRDVMHPSIPCSAGGKSFRSNSVKHSALIAPLIFISWNRSSPSLVRSPTPVATVHPCNVVNQIHVNSVPFDTRCTSPRWTCCSSHGSSDGTLRVRRATLLWAIILFRLRDGAGHVMFSSSHW